MDLKEIEKRISRCESIAKLQLDEVVKISEALVEIEDIRKQIIELELKFKQIDSDSIREIKYLFNQTQKTISIIVDKLNKGGR